MNTSRFLFGTAISTALLFTSISSAWAGETDNDSREYISSLSKSSPPTPSVESVKGISSHPIFTLLPEDLRSSVRVDGMISKDVLSQMPADLRNLAARVWFNGPSANTWENFLLSFTVEKGLEDMIRGHETKMKGLTEEALLEAFEPLARIHKYLTDFSLPLYRDSPELVRMVGDYFSAAYGFLLSDDGEFPMSNELKIRAGNRENCPEQTLVRHQRFLTLGCNPTQGFYGEQETDPEQMSPVARHCHVKQLRINLLALYDGSLSSEEKEERADDWRTVVHYGFVDIGEKDYMKAVQAQTQKAQQGALAREYLDKFPTKKAYQWVFDCYDKWIPTWKADKRMKRTKALMQEFLGKFSDKLGREEYRSAIEFYQEKSSERDQFLKGYLERFSDQEDYKWVVGLYSGTKWATGSEVDAKNRLLDHYVSTFKLGDEEEQRAISLYKGKEKRDERVEAYLERAQTKEAYKWAIEKHSSYEWRTERFKEFWTNFGKDFDERDYSWASKKAPHDMKVKLGQDYAARFSIKEAYDFFMGGLVTHLSGGGRYHDCVELSNWLVDEYIKAHGETLSPAEYRSAVSKHSKDAWVDERVNAHLEANHDRTVWTWGISVHSYGAQRDRLVERFLTDFEPSLTQEDFRAAISRLSDQAREDQRIEGYLKRYNDSLTQADYQWAIEECSDQSRKVTLADEYAERWKDKWEKNVYEKILAALYDNKYSLTDPRVKEFLGHFSTDSDIEEAVRDIKERNPKLLNELKEAFPRFKVVMESMKLLEEQSDK